MNEKIKYWVELAEYDLETAEAMLSSKRFLYVGFMCHQSIEKILKALFVSKFKESPPYTHSLAFLSEKSGILNEYNEQQNNFITIMEPMNIEARYPSYKHKLLKDLDKEKSQDILNNTKEMVAWVKTKL